MVWMVRSEMVTALWAWAGLIVAVGLTAIGIERGERPRSESSNTYEFTPGQNT
jgi:hypothetical protein